MRQNELRHLSDSDARKRCFNLGADARLAGLTPAANPFPDIPWDGYWRWGWQHTDESWGQDVKGRWPVVPLPQIHAPGIELQETG